MTGWTLIEAHRLLLELRADPTLDEHSAAWEINPAAELDLAHALAAAGASTAGGVVELMGVPVSILGIEEADLDDEPRVALRARRSTGEMVRMEAGTPPARESGPLAGAKGSAA